MAEYFDLIWQRTDIEVLAEVLHQVVVNARHDLVLFSMLLNKNVEGV